MNTLQRYLLLLAAAVIAAVAGGGATARDATQVKPAQDAALRARG